MLKMYCSAMPHMSYGLLWLRGTELLRCTRYQQEALFLTLCCDWSWYAEPFSNARSDGMAMFFLLWLRHNEWLRVDLLQWLICTELFGNVRFEEMATFIRSEVYWATHQCKIWRESQFYPAVMTGVHWDTQPWKVWGDGCIYNEWGALSCWSV